MKSCACHGWQAKGLLVQKATHNAAHSQHVKQLVKLYKVRQWRGVPTLLSVTLLPSGQGSIPRLQLGIVRVLLA